jgi:predicted phage terminase large subunit-like protein
MAQNWTLPASSTNLPDNLPPSLRMVHAWPAADQVELLMSRQRQATADTFAHFIRQANPRYEFYPHVLRLLGVLDRVLNGSIKRLMVFMPPRHFKSETISRLFSAYYLAQFPYRWVGLAAYGADLAYSLSRNARTNYVATGGELRQAKGMRQWETYGGGGMWAAGVGGAATGKGFNLGIIDDPLKNAEEASSETIRAKQKDWYRSVFTTRQAPDAAIIVIQTRWHEDDLSGWLLAQEHDEPEGWHIVCMEALKPDQPQPFPLTCTVEDDPRLPGAALCPERYPVQRLEQLRGQLGSYFFASLYQQRPTPPGGGMFQRDWFGIVGAAPAQATRIRAWDRAATEKDGDYTVGALLAKDGDNVFYVEDVIRGQFSDLATEKIIAQTAQIDAARGNVTTWLEQEPGSSGKAVVQVTIRALAGYSVKAERSTGDKATRAQPFAAQCEARNIKLVRGAWNSAYLDELASFPYGAHDDQVDGSSLAFNKLALPGPKAGTW